MNTKTIKKALYIRELFEYRMMVGIINSVAEPVHPSGAVRLNGFPS